MRSSGTEITRAAIPPFSNHDRVFRKLSRVSADGRNYTGIGRVLLPKIARLASDLRPGQWVKDSVA